VIHLVLDSLNILGGLTPDSDLIRFLFFKTSKIRDSD